MKRPVIVIGAGGHAAVVADAILASGGTVLGFTDADPARHGALLCGLPVLGDDRVLARYGPGQVSLANGIGGLGEEALPLRQRLQQGLEGQGWRFVTVIHPSAVVSRFARLGAAVQVMAGAVVQPGAALEQGCIINTGAVVEHDSVVGQWSQLAPRAVLCGDTRLGPGCHVGAGAVLRQGLALGAHTRVGAGAVVIKDFAGNGMLLGVPARQVEL